jgi:hypothetical protein
VLVFAALNKILTSMGYERRRKRRRLVLIFGVIFTWLSFVSFLSTQNFLNNFSVLPPRISVVFLPPLLAAIIMGKSRAFRGFLTYAPQRWLLLVNIFRAGIGILFYALYRNHVIPIQMTFLGKNLDVYIGVSALLLSFVPITNRYSKLLLVIWNVLGLTSLVTLVVLATLSAPFPFHFFNEPEQNTMIAYFPFVLMPGFVIPFYTAIHLFSLNKCLSRLIDEGKNLNDNTLRYIGIPTLTILVNSILNYGSGGRVTINFVFFFLISMLYVFLLWEGDRLIINYIRLKYPEYLQTVKRVLFQMVAIVVFTTITVISIDYFLSVYVFHRFPSALNNTKDVFIGMIVSTIMLIIYESIYFFTKWKDNMLQLEEIKRSQIQNLFNSLKNRVNPHFLFNSLSSLSSLLKEDQRESSRFVQELSNVYRYILQSNENELSFLKSELKFLSSYHYILSIRYQGKIDLRVNVAEQQMMLRIPTLILQVMIENAIYHNTVSEENPLILTVASHSDTAIIVSNNLNLKRNVIDIGGAGLSAIRQRYALHGIDIETKIDNNQFMIIAPLFS